MGETSFATRFAGALRRCFEAIGRGLVLATTKTKVRSTLLWLLALFLVGWYVWEGVVRVREGEVGVIVDNVSGKSEVADAVGYRFVFPILQSFFRLDRRIQTLVMAEEPSEGFRGGDAVRIKTKDGSDVSIDVQVTYHLVPSGAADLLRDAGQANAFAELWVRSAVRAMVARSFGQLNAESVYDADQRTQKAKELLALLNEELAPQHIEILDVVPKDLRFFKEYEEVIKQKKIKDQERQQHISEAHLAEERQKTDLAQATFEAEQVVQRATGDAESTKADADGYAARVRIDADAELVKATREADGTLAKGLAEAQGIKEQVGALAGAGGVNLVALTYAKKLAQMSFTGVPVAQEPTQGNFRVQQIPASLPSGATGSAFNAGQDANDGGMGPPAPAGAPGAAPARPIVAPPGARPSFRPSFPPAGLPQGGSR